MSKEENAIEKIKRREKLRSAVFVIWNEIKFLLKIRFQRSIVSYFLQNEEKKIFNISFIHFSPFIPCN